ncbi:MAG: patatin-like phospholipase family protein [Clostridia bacterium]|nr:patatin-like phospholipase family protein [Clostridia bacterium]
MRIGIAYSGGVSKCAYQIGFTKALLKFIDRSEIKAVSGSSMGLFSAYALSANRLDRIEWIYRKMDIESPVKLFWEVAAKGLMTKTLDEFMNIEDRLQIPVCFPVCYIPIFSTRYYWLRGEYNPIWKKYIKAAAYFPSLHLTPMFQRGRLVLDGGAVDNIPIYPLLNFCRPFATEQPLDLIIALHFDARYDNRRYFFGETPILDLDVSICNDFKKNHFDFSSEYVTEMLNSAEKYGEKICAILFDGDCSKEGIKRKIDTIFLMEHEQRERNSSADALVSLLNVLGRTFRSKSDCNKKLF